MIQFATSKVFCVGIGGIGVSGLAQLMVHCGARVSGSDRGLAEEGKASLYDSLRRQGMALYPQDGSGVRAEMPDCVVISSAVEDGNLDLVAAAERNIPVIHRAEALAQVLEQIGCRMIAVAGSCGKTSVTGWIASALHALGERVLMVNGGYTLEFESENTPGNFHTDESPTWAVVEVDESDRSLLSFRPDFGVLLNIGNDHYSQDELARVFLQFLRQCKTAVTVPSKLSPMISNAGLAVPIRTFGTEGEEAADFHVTDYATDADGIQVGISNAGRVVSSQTGRHSALNACAVLSILSELGLGRPSSALCEAAGAFRGIRQRFEVVGRTATLIPVVNDYAHNPEKVAAAISAAHERFGTPLLCVFQPHGFAPLGFMREALKESLKSVLLPGDQFCFLPVYYAGGTASFSPTAEEVAEGYSRAGLAVCASSRENIAQRVSEATREDFACVLVMGARDSSLCLFSVALTARFVC